MDTAKPSYSPVKVSLTAPRLPDAAELSVEKYRNAAVATFFVCTPLASFALLRIFVDGHWISAIPLLNVLFATYVVVHDLKQPAIKTEKQLARHVDRFACAVTNVVLAAFALFVCC